MENVIQTKHNLDFQVAQSPYSVVGKKHMLFKVGTCHGQWGDSGDSYFILSVMNDEIGNGHLDDVFEWFEYSAKRDGKNLLVLECMNKNFHHHLIVKRGFVALDDEQNNCIKIFNEDKYKLLLKEGNGFIDKKTFKK
jgi:hypothetical protein